MHAFLLFSMLSIVVKLYKTYENNRMHHNIKYGRYFYSDFGFISLANLLLGILISAVYNIFLCSSSRFC